MKVDLVFDSRRSPVFGQGGMAAASQPLAVIAGLEILRMGGTSADAAVAMAAVLNVTEPTSTGLGGDAFCLYYQAQAEQVFALNGSGRAPRALSLERLLREGLGENLPWDHPYTITVPGACSTWCALVKRFGRLSLSEILAPAEHLAETGFPVSPLTSLSWQRAANGLLSRAVNGRELTLEGRGPQPGEVFHNPGLARTLRLIASEGEDAFYRGPIAEAIVAVVQEAGGCIALEDLAQHSADWVEPISTVYRDLRVWECPPNGQGLAALLALNLLQEYDLASLPPLSAERLHLEIEAVRLGLADAKFYAADPAFAPAPLEELLSRAYAQERRKQIDPLRAGPLPAHGFPPVGKDTVYFCVVDRYGNACSFINSNYMGFGTGIVPRGWGFSLQDRGHNFSLVAGHPNALAPGKRPYHTIIPGMLTREADGSLYAPFGMVGGFMQPQGHVQMVTGLVDDGLDPQTALDRPRFCVDVQGNGEKVNLELGIPPRIVKKIRDMGHAVEVVRGTARGMFGRGQVIIRDPHSGVLCGGSDPRADGCAMGML
jgi:gamma-glutamyltranspeptidase / glutathione hydrolase